MNTIIIFLWIMAGFISWSFWEAYIEGKNPWGKKQCGWKFKLTKNFTLTAYHFWLNVMFIFFLSLPVVIYGWDWEIAGIITSAALIGFIVQDFLWYAINPHYSFKKFNPKDAGWYPWVNLGIIKIPKTYIIGIVLALLSWYFLWR